ncbi:hypothetical protein [Dialister succinatiphilus]|uniref:hypothetical protein n=1 Tax=Dialister succinatiphilus TaxID=487173 RepID=UPI00402606FA
MQCEEWDDANSELFKESHDEAVHKNSYESRLYELISASLTFPAELSKPFIQKIHTKRGCEKMLAHFFTAPFYSQ